VDALFADGHRLQQHAHFAQRFGQGHDILRVFDILFGEVAVQQVDAALVIDLVGGHVLQTNLVVDALAGAAHAGDDKHAGPDGAGHVGANADHLPKVFVAGDEKVGAIRRLPILGLVDFAVGAIDAHAQHLDQHAAPAGDARQV